MSQVTVPVLGYWNYAGNLISLTVDLSNWSWGHDRVTASTQVLEFSGNLFTAVVTEEDLHLVQIVIGTPQPTDDPETVTPSFLLEALADLADCCPRGQAVAGLRLALNNLADAAFAAIRPSPASTRRPVGTIVIDYGSLQFLDAEVSNWAGH